MDPDYLDIALWFVGSVAAVWMLVFMMRRRRDQLVDQLHDYVERQRSRKTKPAGDKTE